LTSQAPGFEILKLSGYKKTIFCNVISIREEFLIEYPA